MRAAAPAVLSPYVIRLSWPVDLEAKFCRIWGTLQQVRWLETRSCSRRGVEQLGKGVGVHTWLAVHSGCC